MVDKKKPLDSDSLDDDIFDLDDLDFDIDMDAPKKGSPIRRFMAGARKGVLESLETKTVLRNFAANALPKGYSRAGTAAATLANETKEMMRQLEQSHSSDLSSIVAASERLAPLIKKTRGDKAEADFLKRTEAARKRLADIERENRNRRSSGADQRKADQAESDQRELTETLVQLSAHQEKSTEKKLKSERVERSIRDRVNAGRFDLLNGRITKIADGITSQVNYQEQITHNFQRKSLEIQYKSMFLLRDMADKLTVAREVDDKAYTALVHNTALPDHMKLGDASRLKFGIKDTLTSRMADRFLDNLPSYFGSFYQKAGQNIQDRIGEMVSNLGMITSQMGMLDMGGGNLDKADMMGNILAGEASGRAQRWGASKLGSMASPFIRKFSDRTGGMDYQLQYMLDNLPSMATDFVQDYSKGGVVREGLRNLLSSFIPAYQLDDNIKDGSYQTIDRPVAFNQLTNRSIVEVIPGYLSRILHEARMLRTGDTSIEREVYDITSGRFTGYREAKEAQLRRFVTEGDRRRSNLALNEAMGVMDRDNELSDEARHALRERMMRDASTGKHFDLERYLLDDYGDETPESTVNELNNFFRNHFDLDGEGRMVKNAQNRRKLLEFSDGFNLVRDAVPDPRKEIRRVFGTGAQEVLRELGLVHTEQGEDRINYEAFWSLLTEGGDDRNFTRPDDPTEDDPWSQAKGVFKGYKDKAQSLFDRAKGKAVDAGVDAVGTIAQRFTRRDPGDYTQGMVPWEPGKLRTTSDEITWNGDVFGVDERQPLMTESLMAAGHYIDELTGRTIRSVKDVTGPIVDRYGRQVASYYDIAEGLVSQHGDRYEIPGIKARMAAAGERLRESGRNLRGRVGSHVERIVAKIRDIRIMGTDRTVMTAQKIREGVYVDENTKMVIGNIDDVTGPVRDTERDEVVLTDAEFHDGIIDTDGKKNRPGSMVSRLRRGLGIVANPFKFAFKHGLNIASKIGGFVVQGIFGGKRWVDAYLPGRESPVLLARDLREGKYVDASTGKPIYSVDDIKGSIVDSAKGEVVVTEAELSNLMTIKGAKHPIAGRKGLLGRLTRGYGRLAGSYYRKLGQLTGTSGATDRASRWINDSEKEIDAKAIKTPTDGLLKRILSLLDRRLEKEGPREGSWQDILARNRAAKEAKEDEKDTKKQVGILGKLGGIMSGIGDFFTGGKKGEEESSEGGFWKGVATAYAAWKAKGILGKTGMLLKGAGKAAWWVTAGLAKGLAWGVTGLVSILGIKAVAVGATVAAVGYGAYSIYRRRARTRGDFQQLRMMQYGSEPRKYKYVNRLLNVEEYLEPMVVRRTGQEPFIDTSRLDGQKVYDLLKIKDTPESHARVNAWFDNRFMPVFIAYHRALSQFGPQLKLEDIDEGIADGQKSLFLEAVSFGNSEDSPYNWADMPWDETAVAEVAPVEIQERISRLRRKFERYEDERTVGTEGIDPELEDEVEPEPQLTTGRRALNLARSLSVGVTGKYSPMRFTPIGWLTKATLSEGGLGRIVGQYKPVLPQFRPIQGQLKALQTIRLRAYGLDELNAARVRAMLMLESNIHSQMVNDAGAFVFNGDIETVISDNSALFGINPGNSEDVDRFTRWFNLRFIPVFSTYLTAKHQADPNLPFERAEHRMDIEATAFIAKQIMSAKVTIRDEETSIWSVDHLIFKEAATDLSELETLAKEAMAYIDELANDRKLKSEHERVSRGDYRAGESGSAQRNLGASIAQRAVQAGRRPGAGANSPLPGLGGGTFNVTGTRTAVGSNVTGGIPGLPSGISRTGGPSDAPGGDLIFSEGTGGSWESIPRPTANKSPEGAAVTLRAVEEMTGVDANLLATIAMIESSFDYTAKNPDSSARGWFQFIDDTWDASVKKFGPKYGVTSDPGRRLRWDPRFNALMGAELLKDNARIMRSQIRRPVTSSDMYLAHFLGAPQAGRILALPGSAIASQHFPKAAESNRVVFGLSRGRPRTVNEIINWSSNSLSSKWVNLPTPKSTQQEEPWLPSAPPMLAAMQDEGSDERGGGIDLNAAAAAAASQVGINGVPTIASSDEPLTQRTTSRTSYTAIGNAAAAAAAAQVGAPRAPTVNNTEDDANDVLNMNPIARRTEAQRTVATQQNRATAERVELSNQQTRALANIAERQLETQKEMRDYLKYLAGKFKDVDLKDAFAGGQQLTAQQTTNDTSRPPQAAARRGGNDRPPIAMRDG